MEKRSVNLRFLRCQFVGEANHEEGGGTAREEEGVEDYHQGWLYLPVVFGERGMREFHIDCEHHGESVITYEKSTLPKSLQCPKIQKTRRCKKSFEIIQIDNVKVGSVIHVEGEKGRVEKLIFQDGEEKVILEGDEKEYDLSIRIIEIPYEEVEALPIGKRPLRYWGEGLKSGRTVSYKEAVWRLARWGMNINDMIRVLSIVFDRDKKTAETNIRTTIRRLKREGWSFYPCNGEGKSENEVIMLCGKGIVPRCGITVEKKKKRRRRKREQNRIFKK